MSTKPSKKKGYVVPSRYMQSAEKVSLGSSIRNKSTMKSKSGSRSLSPKSPILRDENSRPCTISTPTSEGKCTMPHIDESAISNIGLSQLSHSRRNSDKTGESVKKSLYQKSTSVKSNERVLNQRNKESEDDISILYCEYLQAKFLESCTIETVQERCKDSVEKIYKVWYYIQAFLGKTAKVNKDFNVINYFVQAHEHIKKQEKIILPMIELIPSLEEQYKKIAKAVHRVRHTLEVKDVVLSDVDCKEVTLLLQEITLLLRSITNAVEGYDQIINASDVKLKFVNQGQLISDELNRASEMLSEASSDLISEMSLQLS